MPAEPRFMPANRATRTSHSALSRLSGARWDPEVGGGSRRGGVAGLIVMRTFVEPGSERFVASIGESPGTQVI